MDKIVRDWLILLILSQIKRKFKYKHLLKFSSLNYRTQDILLIIEITIKIAGVTMIEKKNSPHFLNGVLSAFI